MGFHAFSIEPVPVMVKNTPSVVAFFCLPLKVFVVPHDVVVDIIQPIFSAYFCITVLEIVSLLRQGLIA